MDKEKRLDEVSKGLIAKCHELNTKADEAMKHMIRTRGLIQDNAVVAYLLAKEEYDYCHIELVRAETMALTQAIRVINAELVSLISPEKVNLDAQLDHAISTLETTLANLKETNSREEL